MVGAETLIVSLPSLPLMVSVSAVVVEVRMTRSAPTLVSMNEPAAFQDVLTLSDPVPPF